MAIISHALDNGLRILELLAQQGEPCTLTEICRELELPKSSTHRLLSTLERREYVERDGSLRYSFGRKLLGLVGSYDPWLRLRRAASPVMHDLTRRSGETCHLAVLSERRAVYVDKVNSPRAIGMASRIGATTPLHASSVGKALLSTIPMHELDAYIAECGLPRLTKNTITSPEELKEHLRRIREQGYAVDYEEEEDGIMCVGTPLFDYTGQVVAALSLAFLAKDTDEARVAELAELVRTGAAEISARLGHRPSNLI